MTYTFRNRFRLGDGDRLDADVPEIKLADSAEDGLVTLWPVQREVRTGGGFIFAVEITKRGTLLSQADELVLQGDGYFSANDAAAAGRKWRQYLTVALAREFRAVDFGPDDSVTPGTDLVYGDDPPDLFQGIGILVGDRVITDDPRLLVFPTEPITTFVNFVGGTATVRVSGWLDRFEQRISRARERDHEPWDTQKTVAYRLVHLALRDSNPETRHIQLATAIEVLFEEQYRRKPILDALDKFLAEVDEWPESEVKSRMDELSESEVKSQMADILRQNKKESILRAGQKYVAAKLDGTYGDKTPADFFKHVYNIRSRLVHRARDNKPRPTNGELTKVHGQLLKFVLDLLDAYETG